MKRTANKIASFTILALIFWGGGVGCVVCCAADSSEDVCGRVDSSDVDALDATGHSCCVKPASDPSEGPDAFLTYLPLVKPCCVHQAALYGPAVIPQPGQSGPAIIKAARPSFAIEIEPRASNELDPIRPADKGGTYLRCCVLLI
ncbi:MAG TPA: hypothetical protein VFQ92_20680 [Blastocatellia bacterium]|nr:hypothetical protein [Blastocatellia bacterium]